jgi:hypothetical protein
MPTEPAAGLSDIADTVAQAIASFVDSCRQCFGSNLKSVVLYGSAAEGRLRATSDVNLLLVLSAFDAGQAAALRGPFSIGHAAVRLTAMFLLDNEVSAAAELFGQKFSDLLRRRRVLYGPDPFEGLSIPRSAVIHRTRQVLLNLTLRLREAYIERGTTPERLSVTIAESAAPLRSCAATVAELEGQPKAPPKEALLKFVAELGDPAWEETMSRMSETRAREFLSPESADATVMRLIDLAMLLRTRVDRLS